MESHILKLVIFSQPILFRIDTNIAFQKVGILFVYTDKLRKQMSSLIEHQSNAVRPFIENIDTVNELCNKPVKLLVDEDNLYIATTA